MRLLASLLLAALLAGCTVGPNYSGPPAAASGAAPPSRFVRGDDPSLSNAPGLANWWTELHDAALDRLIAEALDHSPTIDQATASVREAQANLRRQKASGKLSASANATYIHARLPGIDIDASTPAADTDLDFYNVGLDASWELDLFGGGRRGVEQVQANVGARFADLADAQVSLTARVAQAYIALREVQQRIALTARSTDLQCEQVALIGSKVARGAASHLDLARLRDQLESGEAEALPLAAQRTEYLDLLAVLTGQVPGAIDQQLGRIDPIPLPPTHVAIGDPAALIARRPDIRSAERRLAASTAGIGVSKAKELPAVRLLGLLGLGGTSASDIFDFAKLTTLAAPTLSWSFLDFGKARAETRGAEAQQDQAEAIYRRTVLAALQDAETALSRFGAARAQLGRLGRARDSADRAAVLNGLRVTAGTSTMIDQLDLQRRQLAAAIAVEQATAQLTQDYVAINKALGLGWTAPSKNLSDVAAR